MKYDTIMCMMVPDTKKANDYECKELTVDKAIKSCDSNYDEIKQVYNLLGQALQSSENANKWMNLVSEARGKLLTLAAKAK